MESLKFRAPYLLKYSIRVRSSEIIFTNILQNMKPTSLFLWRLALTFAGYFVAKQIAQNAFPYTIYFYEGFDQLGFYILYFILILFKTIILIWLLKSINQRKIKLIGTVTFVIFGLQSFMLIMEVWFFRAIYDFNTEDIRTFILQNLAILLIIVPVAAWINGVYYKKTTPAIWQANELTRASKVSIRSSIMLS